MVRLLVLLVVVLGLAGGGLAWLAYRDSQKAMKRVEKVVPLADLQK